MMTREEVLRRRRLLTLSYIPKRSSVGGYTPPSSSPADGELDFSAESQSGLLTPLV